jgi:uncharacterized protein YicC (UPF0701 family)
VIVQDEVLPLDPRARADRDAAILGSLAAAFDALIRARGNEGAKLASVMGGLVDEIDRLTREAAALSAAQPAQLRDKACGPIEGARGQRVDIGGSPRAGSGAPRSEGRYPRGTRPAGRACAGSAHLMASGTAVGRKLDFLAQEFNREANTLCSKSTDIALTRVGLALKATIDQFREQAQNVE